MTWSFDESLSTAKDEVRDWLGDVIADNPQRSDEQIAADLVASGGNVILAAAISAEKLAFKHSQIVTSSVGGYSEQASDLYKQWTETAKRLRALASDSSFATSVSALPAWNRPETENVFDVHMFEADASDAVTRTT